MSSADPINEWATMFGNQYKMRYISQGEKGDIKKKNESQGRTRSMNSWNPKTKEGGRGQSKFFGYGCHDGKLNGWITSKTRARSTDELHHHRSLMPPRKEKDRHIFL